MAKKNNNKDFSKQEIWLNTCIDRTRNMPEEARAEQEYIAVEEHNAYMTAKAKPFIRLSQTTVKKPKARVRLFVGGAEF